MIEVISAERCVTCDRCVRVCPTDVFDTGPDGVTRLEQIGWVKPQRRPRMVSVQAEGCAPVVRAYQQGAENAQPWEGAATLADGLRVPRAIGDFLILRAVRESGGTALAMARLASAPTHMPPLASRS